MKICLIEDDPIMGESLCDRFALEGLAYDWCRTASEALARIGREPYSAVISDIRLPDLSGEELFGRLAGGARHSPPFIFITGYGSIDRAVAMLKLGAADYITKPFDIEQLIEKVRALLDTAVAQPSDSPTSLGISPAMKRIADMLPRIASHADTVLVSGESGVGKERVAQLLHRLGDPEDSRPFVAVNCAALSESLLEAELFGFEKGAFTGALRTKRGVFEQAEGGTLFLDEIGEMPPAMQAKLLRAIQERRVTRVGGEQSIPVHFRLICATNRDLRSLVTQGAFREDLFYRVNVVHVRIPPLRERRDDILWLARGFLAEWSRRHSLQSKRLGVAAEAALLAHEWPGNIRELRHCIERACILSGRSVLEPADLSDEREPPAESGGEAASLTLADYLRRCERHYLLEALETRGWQIGQTAAALGISRKNLWERMRRLGVTADPAAEETSK